MFHIDLSSKRSKLAIRFFTYGVMTITVVGITAICMLLALGYRFDRNSLSFQQGGLIQISSIPSGAGVSIDGKQQGYNTPGKSDIAPGIHKIELQKDKYQPWSKSVSLAASQLLWLNYAHLIPTEVKTIAAKTFDTVFDEKTSLDRKWMVVQPASDKPDLTLVDLQDPKKLATSSIAIPESILTKRDGAVRQFNIVEWDPSSRYLLVRYQAADVVEYIRVDRSNPVQALNLTQTFQLPVSDIHFSANNADVFYAKNDSVLRRLDVGAKSISEALVSNLDTFSVSPSGPVAFSAAKQHTAGDPASTYQYAGLYDGSKEVQVREYGAGARLLVKYAEYFGHGYVAITDAGAPTAIIVRDPTEMGNKNNRVFATLAMKSPALWLSFSDNGRMIVAQNGSSVTSYDLEIAQQYQYDVATVRPVTRPFTWLDDYYLATDANQTVKTFEFDGTNAHDLTGAEEGYGVTFSVDNTYLYSLGKNAQTQKYQLQASKLIIN
ncbi:MAG TPA: PEGA domain-containing protein [Candidatus Saccharimonadales bacterium]|jgi:hypothetical protein|nr:PEGA domain-containing protein [Candidatus Saccharimonadales bacterium]